MERTETPSRPMGVVVVAIVREAVTGVLEERVP